MSMILMIIGFTFFFAGFLSLIGVTDFGLQYVTIFQLHNLPFLRDYPVVLVYTVAGALLMVIAFALSPVRKR